MQDHLNKVNEFKVALAAIITALSALWGWYGWLIVFWISAMALDVLTGMSAACLDGRWNSATARIGLWHKAGEIFVLLAAALLDLGIRAVLDFVPDINLPFRYTVLLGPVVVAWYLITEIGSIVENAEKVGAPVPKWMLKIIGVVQDKIDDAMEIDAEDDDGKLPRKVPPDEDAGDNREDNNTSEE